MPVLVLGNKIDRPEAISEGGLRGAFALDGQVTGKVGVFIYRNNLIPASVWGPGVGRPLPSINRFFVTGRETCR